MEWQSQYPSLEFQYRGDVQSTCSCSPASRMACWRGDRLRVSSTKCNPPTKDLNTVDLSTLAVSVLSFFLSFFLSFLAFSVIYSKIIYVTYAGLAFFHFSSSFRRQHTMSVWWIALPILALVMSPSTSSAAEGEWGLLVSMAVARWKRVGRPKSKPAGGLGGGRCKPPSGVRGSAPKNFEKCAFFNNSLHYLGSVQTLKTLKQRDAPLFVIAQKCIMLL